MLAITVNGDLKRIPSTLSLADFLSDLGLDPKKVAVERNLEIVPKSTYAMVEIGEGDTLEIVHFIGGG
ncbi:MAG: sulfur carrier protein ThiS [Kordiimonadaceae bacterium]|nr:sulfur carrier protein ThiS [Kordiimonadaceae bacterium]